MSSWGLRGKLRHNASGEPENTFNSNSDGTYSFAAGVPPTQSSPTAVWSFEWPINTNYNGTTEWNLNDSTYELGIDTDPSQRVTFGSLIGVANPFDPINDANPGARGDVKWDHAIGNNSTGNFHQELVRPSLGLCEPHREL